ncbi:BTB/POZ domain-containing protein At5g48800 [Phalaenopsis equestris]|uniref:BTB/POZ domain-containing protein At5g48800 n=1 Tax=Phalaenopsis equestris TaxID=78828 RepID=UPI0009E45C9E|nr:BTB/POZ domain-containing protein At5g48800 [Phalaenopsis equestris]XP_020576284.1 BTB/POZ domain-containing protein At5g48800 [Phalaenopsis equestris]XP_020576286.1 BTB/POZ domain-containing protein At5g48800 [Phalaenopsis equestris]
MEQTAVALCVSSPQQRIDHWIFLDVPSDIIVDVNGACFSLHKFPLISRSGRIRKLIAEHRDADILRIDLLNLPGGFDTFELVAKFCYDVHFEITPGNIAQLLCASEYLEMNDQYAPENLALRSESYLDGVICKNLEMCVEVLQHCENLLPLADELKIVSRCVDAIASKACAEQIASSFSRLEYSSSGRLHMNKHAKSNGDWWIEDLSVLRVDLFQRVIEAMKCRGVRPESIGSSLVRFAEKTFRKLPNIWSINFHPRLELVSSSLTSQIRIVVESIATLLPLEKHAVSISFLFGLLKSAMMLDCMMSCRLNLERRIGYQLELASLDDLLIPSCQNVGDTLFDVGTIHRILVIFSQQEDSDDEGSGYGSDCRNSPSQTAMVKVARLVDSYLAEIAPDSNLKLAKFIAIADTIPGYARTTTDGLYRAIDIYLKAHKEASDLERKRLYKLVDFQKLSDEASAHASQNERLPLQAIVQILYIEQMRLRNALDSSYLDDNQKISHPSWSIRTCMPNGATSPRDNYASLRRENRELKLQLARMHVRLKDLERDHSCMKQDLEISSKLKILSSISRKIGNLGLFGRKPFRGASSLSKYSQKSDSSLTGRTCA